MSETLPGMRLVLVVDDDPDVRDVVVTLLELINCTVVEASSGRGALEMLAARPAIALIVTDVRMPGMSGLELASQVAALRGDVPVILVSGYYMTEQDGVHVLRKPFSLDQLKAAVAAALPAR